MMAETIYLNILELKLSLVTVLSTVFYLLLIVLYQTSQLTRKTERRGTERLPNDLLQLPARPASPHRREERGAEKLSARCRRQQPDPGGLPLPPPAVHTAGQARDHVGGVEKVRWVFAFTEFCFSLKKE